MPAVNQIQNPFDYIAAENPPAADRTVKRIREVVLLRARMPYAGRVGRVAGTREIPITGTPYVAAYRIVENSIHVLAVFHGAEQWPESF
jgi:toxin ParE1/3/4